MMAIYTTSGTCRGGISQSSVERDTWSRYWPPLKYFWGGESGTFSKWGGLLLSCWSDLTFVIVRDSGGI